MTSPQRFTRALIAQLPALRRHAAALVGNAALADDLVQDCLERALKHPGQLRELSRMGGWLRRILRNLYTDEISRGRTRGLEQDIVHLTSLMKLGALPVDTGAIRDFVRAVNQLSVEHREILLLASVEDLNYREIGEELSIPIGTVMSRLARARERLRVVREGAGAEIIPFRARWKDRS